jgi:hypothetical protein
MNLAGVVFDERAKGKGDEERNYNPVSFITFKWISLCTTTCILLLKFETNFLVLQKQLYERI